MVKNLIILAVLALVIALPFALRKPQETGEWKPGDPTITIVSPHNEAIRYEFARGFSAWHKAHYGTPVKIEWLNIGGTTEITRYLSSEYTSKAKSWWQNKGNAWPAGMTDVLTKGSFLRDRPTKAEDLPLWEQQKIVYDALRATDDANQVSVDVDLFFGGGQFDHSDAFNKGLTVPPWPEGAEPHGLFVSDDGTALIPEKLAGEIWRTPTVIGNVISTFGICYNPDRLADLGVPTVPTRWADLADPRFFRQVGVTDPTKSGSVAKAFEMIVHQQMHDAAASYLTSNRATNGTPVDVDSLIAANEKRIAAYMAEKEKTYRAGDVPEDLTGYQAALEQGWINGIRLVQKIGANARYFTDSATKVPIDVSVGDAAVGMAIDFYGRYQAENSAGPDGKPRMVYVTPLGGSSVSCDPISLLRGARNRETAVRFIEYLISEEGQRLWTYKPGTVGGPEKYALRRLPIRRDFYPSTNPTIEAKHDAHEPNAADDLADPAVDPYTLAKSFVYYPRWTNNHFGMQRDLIRSMCMDSGDELRSAWARVKDTDAGKSPGVLGPLPTVSLKNKKGEMVDVPLTWRSALTVSDRNFDKSEYTRKWTAAFREAYEKVGRK